MTEVSKHAVDMIAAVDGVTPQLSGLHDRRITLLTKNSVISHAGLLRDWAVDGYGLSWIFATGFQRNSLTLFNYGFRPLTLNQ
jgi:hypothetical protein